MLFGPQYRYDYISKVIRNTFWTDVLSHFQIVQLSTDEKSKSLIGKTNFGALRNRFWHFCHRSRSDRPRYRVNNERRTKTHKNWRKFNAAFWPRLLTLTFRPGELRSWPVHVRKSRSTANWFKRRNENKRADEHDRLLYIPSPTNLPWVTWPSPRPLQGRLFIGRLGLTVVNQCDKFANYTQSVKNQAVVPKLLDIRTQNI